MVPTTMAVAWVMPMDRSNLGGIGGALGSADPRMLSPTQSDAPEADTESVCASVVAPADNAVAIGPYVAMTKDCSKKVRISMS
jgi:hypothetical protein